jgi:soluble lytic murein transglycosylase-like protein
VGIESVQARVAEIQTRIDSIASSKNAAFQSILNQTLNQDNNAESSTAAAAGTLGSEYLSSGNIASTGRYCSKCGMPEVLNAYGSSGQYTAAVDTGDGMLEKAAPYMDIIEDASEAYGIPVNVIMGVIKAESDYNPDCVSSAGAMGLIQIMPENAEEYGVTDPFDPRQNIFCGVDEIARHLKTYNGDLKLALAAYNTGPGNIAKRNVTSSSSAEYLTIPQSVRDYVDRVLRYAGLETEV